MVNSYEDLEIYKMSMDLAVNIYKETKKFPKDETYGMRDQIRRAVASVGANIAEGFGRYHYKDKLLFMYNARGSLYETRHFLDLAFHVGYIDLDYRNARLNDTKILSIKLNNFISAIGNINK